MPLSNTKLAGVGVMITRTGSRNEWRSYLFTLLWICLSFTAETIQGHRSLEPRRADPDCPFDAFMPCRRLVSGFQWVIGWDRVPFGVKQGISGGPHSVATAVGA